MYIRELPAEIRREAWESVFNVWRQKRSLFPERCTFQLSLEDLCTVVGRSASWRYKRRVEVDYKEIVREDKPRGYCMPTEDGFWVMASDMDGQSLKRLIVGHELGHVMITFERDGRGGFRRRRWGYRDALGNSKLEERLCDEMAVLLLCPPKEVFEVLKRPLQLCLFEDGLTALAREAAQVFGVPLLSFLRYLGKLRRLCGRRDDSVREFVRRVQLGEVVLSGLA